MPTDSPKLKILILLNRIPYPLNDGGAIGAYNFIKGYAEAGCEVSILAMNTSKHYVKAEKAEEVLGGFGKLRIVDIDNRIIAHRAFRNLFKGTSYIIERFVSADFDNNLKDILQRNDFDIVHVDGLPPAAYIDTLRQFSSAKISMRAHNVEHVIWERIAANESNPIKKIYVALQAKRLKKFEINALEKCDLVLAISKEDEETIRKCKPGVKTVVVPAGMDIPSKQQNENFDVQNLFFIGSFDWMPNKQGMEWFLKEIWPQLSTGFPDLQLQIAGKKMPPSLWQHADKNIKPLGEVPDAKEFMLKAGVMVVPIISGSGIRIKILEAMALGKTIIATDIATEGLGLTNGENVLIANNAAEFILQIGRCKSDMALCRKIGGNAYDYAFRNYRNSSIFERLILLYREIK